MFFKNAVKYVLNLIVSAPVLVVIIMICFFTGGVSMQAGDHVEVGFYMLGPAVELGQIILLATFGIFLWVVSAILSSYLVVWVIIFGQGFLTINMGKEDELEKLSGEIITFHKTELLWRWDKRLQNNIPVSITESFLTAFDYF